MKKPIIMISVFNRYHELEICVSRLLEHKHEFLVEPEVIVQWACPDIGHLWYFQELLNKGIIHKLIYRERHPDDGKGHPTSFFAALNTIHGLNYIKDNYNPDSHYIIFQHCDVWPRPNTYKMMDQEMQKPDTEAVLFFWANHIAREDVWNTNLFAVSFNDKYWPPTCDKNEADTYERVWGRYLSDANLPGIFKTHNSRELKFEHCHLDEKLNTFPFKPQNHQESLSLSLTGYYTFRQRIKLIINWFRGLFKWQK